jgi:hypothetical protein
VPLAGLKRPEPFLVGERAAIRAKHNEANRNARVALRVPTVNGVISIEIGYGQMEGYILPDAISISVQGNISGETFDPRPPSWK